MLEVEMKFPVTDFAPLRALFLKWGVLAYKPWNEVDHYFNAPDRDFVQTDEALRIRRRGFLNYITYKGPKCDAITKSRTEIEVGLGDGDRTFEDLGRVLVHLGYRPSGIVQKHREVYELRRNGFTLEVCLDDVVGLGLYVEVEIQATERQFEKAKETLLEAAAALGLKDSERRSYLAMLLEAQEGKKP